MAHSLPFDCHAIISAHLPLGGFVILTSKCSRAAILYQQRFLIRYGEKLCQPIATLSQTRKMYVIRAAMEYGEICKHSQSYIKQEYLLYFAGKHNNWNLVSDIFDSLFKPNITVVDSTVVVKTTSRFTRVKDILSSAIDADQLTVVPKLLLLYPNNWENMNFTIRSYDMCKLLLQRPKTIRFGNRGLDGSISAFATHAVLFPPYEQIVKFYSPVECEQLLNSISSDDCRDLVLKALVRTNDLSKLVVFQRHAELGASTDIINFYKLHHNDSTLPNRDEYCQYQILTYFATSAMTEWLEQYDFNVLFQDWDPRTANDIVYNYNVLPDARNRITETISILSKYKNRPGCSRFISMLKILLDEPVNPAEINNYTSTYLCFITRKFNLVPATGDFIPSYYRVHDLETAKFILSRFPYRDGIIYTDVLTLPLAAAYPNTILLDKLEGIIVVKNIKTLLSLLPR